MEGGSHNTRPKEGWRGKNLRINTSDLPHEHGCQNSDECLGQTTLQTPRKTVGFRRLAGGFQPDPSTERQISRFVSTLQDVEQHQGTICVTFLDSKNYFNTIYLPALFLLLRKFSINENNVHHCALIVDCFYSLKQ